MSATLTRPDGAAPAADAAPMIELRGISKRFEKKLDVAGKIARRLGAPVREEVVHAVDGVDLSIAKGEVVGLVGESGCGKSTLGRMVAGIMPPSAGTILRQGRELSAMSAAEARGIGRRRDKLGTGPIELAFAGPLRGEP